MEIPSITAKGALQFPVQHGDFTIVDNTPRGRARARARLRIVRCGNRRARRGSMLAWKSRWSPLRAHFSLQANMATIRLWIIQRADARLRFVRCGNRRVRRGPKITWKPHRSPLRAHVSFQANMPTLRLWIIQRARACALCVAGVDGHVEAPS